jgi:hypothetical protein
MREDDDRSRPVELKRRMLALYRLLNPHDIIVAAFDDLESIVEMYKQEGVASAVLKIGDPARTYLKGDL